MLKLSGNVVNDLNFIPLKARLRSFPWWGMGGQKKSHSFEAKMVKIETLLTGQYDAVFRIRIRIRIHPDPPIFAPPDPDPDPPQASSPEPDPDPDPLFKVLIWIQVDPGSTK